MFFLKMFCFLSSMVVSCLFLSVCCTVYNFPFVVLIKLSNLGFLLRNKHILLKDNVISAWYLEVIAFTK